MSKPNRKTYELSLDDYTFIQQEAHNYSYDLWEIGKSLTSILISSWAILGDKYGFDPWTVEQIDYRTFTAIPLKGREDD